MHALRISPAIALFLWLSVLPGQSSAQPPSGQPRVVQPRVAESQESQIVKQPIPTGQAFEELTAEVAERYRGQIVAAKTPEQKSALAKELLDVAVDRENEPASRYVMLKMAGDLATEAADVATAMRTVAEMDERFEINAVQIKAVMLKRIATIARGGMNKELLSHYLAVADEAARQEQFDIAIQTSRAASAMARKTNDTELVKGLSRRLAALRETQREHEKMIVALAILDGQPIDPAANLAVGRFRCFYMEQWESGVHMLALGDNEQLNKVAVSEMQSTSLPDQQVSIGDAWWKLGNEETGSIQVVMHRRAGHWYRKALPRLVDPKKAAIEERLEKIDATTQPVELSAARLKYALEFTGNQYVRTNVRYVGSRPLTLEAVVMATRSPSANQAVVGTYYYSGMGLMLNRNGYWSILVKDRKARWAFSQQEAQLNKMVHLAGVYNGKSVALFVDGQFQRSTQMKDRHTASKQPIGIGGFPQPGKGGNKFFHGRIAAVRISSAVLYTKNFKPQIPFRVTKDTVALYALEEGEGNIANDLSQFGNHARILGATWVELSGSAE